MVDASKSGTASRAWWPTIGTALAVLLSALGLAVSGLLLQHHLAIAIGSDPLLSGVCGISEHSSCDTVLRSPWAQFRGRPTALWGFLFFSAMFAWYVTIGRPSPHRRWWHLLPVIATAAGTGVCAGLAFFMYTRLPEWCPLCATTHAAAALLFIVTVSLWPRERTLPAADDGVTAATPVAQPTLRQLSVTFLLAAAIGIAGTSEYYRALHKAAAVDFKKRWQVYESDLEMVYQRYMSEPKVDIPVGPDDSVRGPANASHTVVLFVDMQCEFCRGADKLVRERQEQNPGRLRIVFKHFPMNRDCNQFVHGKMHAGACAAAVTAEAARKLGGEDAFWKMHDELFAHQGQFALHHRQFIQEACRRIGIDEQRLWDTIQTQSIWSRISLHEAQARAIKVDSTPEIFLDGRRVNGWALVKFWDFIFSMDRQREKQQSRTAARAASQPAGATPSRPPATQHR